MSCKNYMGQTKPTHLVQVCCILLELLYMHQMDRIILKWFYLMPSLALTGTIKSVPSLATSSGEPCEESST